MNSYVLISEFRGKVNFKKSFIVASFISADVLRLTVLRIELDVQVSSSIRQSVSQSIK